MTHKSTIRLLDKVGENHDAEVLRCKESLTEHLKTIKVAILPGPEEVIVGGGGVHVATLYNVA